MSEHFEQKYIGVVAGVIGTVVLLLGLVGLFLNLG